MVVGGGDWAIRSVSLRGQGKVMKSEGEALLISPTHILREITRPVGQMSPAISGQGVGENSCVCEVLRGPVWGLAARP